MYTDHCNVRIQFCTRPHNRLHTTPLHTPRTERARDSEYWSIEDECFRRRAAPRHTETPITSSLACAQYNNLLFLYCPVQYRTRAGAALQNCTVHTRHTARHGVAPIRSGVRYSYFALNSHYSTLCLLSLQTIIFLSLSLPV